MKSFIIVLLVLNGLLCATARAVPVVTTQGNQVLFGGEPLALAGNSFFWSNNNYGGERYYNRQTVAWLKRDWKSTIVRAAMGVEDPGGYLDDAKSNRDRVIALVEAAIAEDLYVIIDWHSHKAEDNEQAAMDFFADMARRYGSSNNVIFEIYNEPVNTSWPTIKAYAEKVIQVIRDNGANNLVVVGTPFYSQRVDEASNDPIVDFANIAYTLHFYAGTHRDGLRRQAQAAIDNGLPLMVTEWGTVNASGDGAPDQAETQKWVSFLNSNKITYLNWAVNDKQEGASIVKPGASTVGNWPADSLTASGQLVRSIIANSARIPAATTEPDPDEPTIPRSMQSPIMAPVLDLIL